MAKSTQAFELQFTEKNHFVGLSNDSFARIRNAVRKLELEKQAEEKVKESVRSGDNEVRKG
jgi:low affinity Fe/Cu permease